MRRAAGVESFARDPVGRYLAGGAWIHFCAHAELFGIVFFGRADRADVEKLVRSLVIELGSQIAPHRSLVDARALGGVDAGAFEVLNGYVRQNHAKLSEKVTRLALVRPRGMEGALVTGFFGVLDAPYPVSVFDGAAEALGWLGEDQIGAELEEVVAQASGVPPGVAALRALLEERLELGPEEAAAALGLSARTLQRRLQEAGTSFQKEAAAVRLRLAERRMLDTDDPLTAIAIDAGFATLQHFSTAFREATGESPSAWRSKRRRL
jgi:AraC-like DNA-binding protein